MDMIDRPKSQGNTCLSLFHAYYKFSYVVCIRRSGFNWMINFPHQGDHLSSWVGYDDPFDH